MSAPRCRACRFAVAHEEISPGLGTCHRNPPVPFQEMRQKSPLDPKSVGMILVAYFPPVILDREFCGEWQPAVAAANAN